jgi:hypothetical protein
MGMTVACAGSGEGSRQQQESSSRGCDVVAHVTDSDGLAVLHMAIGSRISCAHVMLRCGVKNNTAFAMAYLRMAPKTFTSHWLLMLAGPLQEAELCSTRGCRHCTACCSCCHAHL